MRTKEATEIEALLTKLEPLLPEGIYDEVNDFLSELEEELKGKLHSIEGLKEEVEDLEDQVSKLEDFVPHLEDLKGYIEQLPSSDQEGIVREFGS